MAASSQSAAQLRLMSDLKAIRQSPPEVRFRPRLHGFRKNAFSHPVISSTDETTTIPVKINKIINTTNDKTGMQCKPALG